MTFGLCTLSFVHCILEVRISAVTQTAGRPSTKFAGSCPSLVTEGQSEIHTFLFDVVITYVCRREVYPDEDNPRMKLERLSETFGLIDADGNDAPPPAREEVYNRVRLAASVAYLEAGEDILRTRLSALVEGDASELSWLMIPTRSIVLSRPGSASSCRRSTSAAPRDAAGRRRRRRRPGVWLACRAAFCAPCPLGPGLPTRAGRIASLL